MKLEPQVKRILTYLEANKTINPLTALQHLGVYRLSSVINKLRKYYKINTLQTKGFNKFNEPVKYATYELKGSK